MLSANSVIEEFHRRKGPFKGISLGLYPCCTHLITVGMTPFPRFHFLHLHIARFLMPFCMGCGVILNNMNNKMLWYWWPWQEADGTLKRDYGMGFKEGAFYKDMGTVKGKAHGVPNCTTSQKQGRVCHHHLLTWRARRETSYQHLKRA